MYSIIVAKAGRPLGKHFSTNGDKHAAMPGDTEWLHGDVIGFETIEELAVVLQSVANDPTALIIPNPPLGIPNGAKVCIGTGQAVSAWYNVPSDDNCKILRTIPPRQAEGGAFVIPRLKEFFAPGNVVILDRDIKDSTPAEWVAKSTDEWLTAIDTIIPGTGPGKADRIEMPSSSARIYDTTTGQYRSSKSGHIWMLSDTTIDLGDAPRGDGSKLKIRFDAAAMRSNQCWVTETTNNAGVTVRKLVLPFDHAVMTKGRWLFSGAPTADAPLAVAPSHPKLIKGSTRTVQLLSLPDVTDGELRELNAKHRTSIGFRGDKALTLDTEIETEDYGVMTVRQLHELYLAGQITTDTKIRCQAVFRPESTSWNGITRCVASEFDANEVIWLTHDNGTGDNSWLNDAEMAVINPGWTPNKYYSDKAVSGFLAAYSGVTPALPAGASMVPVGRVDTTPGVVAQGNEPVVNAAPPVISAPLVHRPIDIELQDAWERAISEICSRRKYVVARADAIELFPRDQWQMAWDLVAVAKSKDWLFLDPRGDQTAYTPSNAQFGAGRRANVLDGKFMWFLSKFDIRILNYAKLDSIMDGFEQEIAAEIAARSEGKKLNHEEVEKLRAEIRGSIVGTGIVQFFNAIEYSRQAVSQEVDTSPYNETARFEMLTGRMLRTRRPFAMPAFQDLHETLPTAQFVADFRREYTEFFPGYDDIIKLMAACRFSTHGRQSFALLHCPGGWGKGFLLGALNHLALAYDMKIDSFVKALAGEPSGESVNALSRSSVLNIDEFRHVKGELKSVNTHLDVAEKGQMKSRVRVYLKLMTCAESVRDFAEGSGIDKQFSDRFSYFEGKGSVNDLPLVKQHGVGVTCKALAVMIRDDLSRFYSEWLSLGRSAGSAAADALMAEVHARRSIGDTYGDLNDAVMDEADKFAAWIREKIGIAGVVSTNHQSLDAKLRSGVISSVIVHTDGGDVPAIRVQDAAQFFRSWYEMRNGEKLRGQLAHKVSAIVDLVHEKHGVPGAAISTQRLISELGCAERKRLRGLYITR